MALQKVGGKRRGRPPKWATDAPAPAANEEIERATCRVMRIAKSGWGKFGRIPDYFCEKHVDLQAGECAETIAFQQEWCRARSSLGCPPSLPWPPPRYS
ncbi:MAG: hypothetical protein DMG57_37860 [Acidobacteria bacterium]|nr:MAG: hypothetical protein DMG57_37860 [Acidobacteriota bacterium]